MADAKICDNCKKVIEDIRITIKGYKVETKEKLGYEVNRIEDFCSFNCLSEYAIEEQKLLDEIIQRIEEYSRKSIGGK
mgnify:CR=1 FL=1